MKPSPLRSYGCADYRDEMRLLALRRRLQELQPENPERDRVREEIRVLERAMEMD